MFGGSGRGEWKGRGRVRIQGRAESSLGKVFGGANDNSLPGDGCVPQDPS